MAFKEGVKCPEAKGTCYGHFRLDDGEDDWREEWFEGAIMCNLVDKWCLVEHGKPEDCDYYMEYLKEVKNENHKHP